MSAVNTEKYYLPEPSYWPIVGSLALMIMAIGGVMTMREIDHGLWVLLAGLAIMFFMMFGWFGDVRILKYNILIDS